jgi:PIN domain nuclease of toxin-antitoxin system
MRFVIDTHVWLWWMTTPEKLSTASLDMLNNPRNVLFLSAASVWEVVIKHASGKLHLPAAPDVFVPSRMARDGVTGLAIEHAHVLQLTHLPLHHRDPFDRVIIAQAQVERLPIMTADRLFAVYPVTLIPAR